MLESNTLLEMMGYFSPFLLILVILLACNLRYRRKRTGTRSDDVITNPNVKRCPTEVKHDNTFISKNRVDCGYFLIEHKGLSLEDRTIFCGYVTVEDIDRLLKEGCLEIKNKTDLEIITIDVVDALIKDIHVRNLHNPNSKTSHY